MSQTVKGTTFIKVIPTIVWWSTPVTSVSAIFSTCVGRDLLTYSTQVVWDGPKGISLGVSKWSLGPFGVHAISVSFGEWRTDRTRHREVCERPVCWTVVDVFNWDRLRRFLGARPSDTLSSVLTPFPTYWWKDLSTTSRSIDSSSEIHPVTPTTGRSVVLGAPKRFPSNVSSTIRRWVLRFD